MIAACGPQQDFLLSKYTAKDGMTAPIKIYLGQLQNIEIKSRSRFHSVVGGRGCSLRALDRSGLACGPEGVAVRGDPVGAGRTVVNYGARRCSEAGAPLSSCMQIIAGARRAGCAGLEQC